MPSLSFIIIHKKILISKSMKIRQPRYSKEELAKRGHELYDPQIRSQVEANNYGKIVAIDKDLCAPSKN